MPDDDTAPEEARLEQARASVRVASQNAQNVREKAHQVIRARKRVVFVATFKGARWKVREQMAQILARSIAAPGGVWYVLICLVGLVYSRGYYDKFDVNILNLFSTPDFLLSAFNNLLSLAVAVLVPLAMLVVLGATYWVSNYKRAYLSALGNLLSYRLRVGFAAFFGAGALFLSVVVYAFGCVDSTNALSDPKFVRVTIRNDSTQPPTLLPPAKRTILLGTTSDFHLFYACDGGNEDVNKTAGGTESNETRENSGDGVLSKAWRWLIQLPSVGPKDTQKSFPCTAGKTFIVPTDNVASVSFNGTEPEPRHNPDLSAVVEAISSLKEKIVDHDVVIDLGDDANVTVEATELAKAIAALNERIEKLNAPDIDLSPLVGAIEGLGVSELLVPVPDLAKAIHVLNGHIKALSEGPIGKSGTDTKLEELTDAIASLGQMIKGLDGTSFPDGCPSRPRRVARIGPFSQGEHELDKQMKDQIKKAFSELKSRTPVHVILIGRVDDLRLNDQGIAKYRSDIGLAHSRAKSVWRELADKFAKHQWAIPAARLLSGGPAKKKKTSPSTERDKDKDRSVEIWACWR